jgi:signal transduction histidine kinase
MLPHDSRFEVHLRPLEVKKPRWPRVYLLLAAFDVFTVLFSLYVNYRIVTIFRASVRENHFWVVKTAALNAISAQAAAVNAPGNDVFETNDIDSEEKRMKEAFAGLQATLNALQVESRAQPGEFQRQGLEHDLEAVERFAKAMAIEAAAVFLHLRTHERDQATRSMAAMDRHLAKLYESVNRLRGEIGTIQQDVFDRHTTQAESVQRFEYVIGALIFLMIVGAIGYGSRIRRQAEWQTQQESLSREAQLRESFLERVLQAQEEERGRVARELHDGIGQSLTSLMIGLRRLEEAGTSQGVQDGTARLRQQVGEMVEDVRRMARGLRPAVLDDLGLAAALEVLAVEYAKTHQIHVHLQTSDLESHRLPAALETTLYRIVQEALTNVAKHAHARNVEISVGRHEGSISVTIEDDGQGFDSDAPLEGGFGLESIKERSSLHHGTCEIDSAVGAGTRISVTLPLSENQHGQDSSLDRR